MLGIFISLLIVFMLVIYMAGKKAQNHIGNFVPNQSTLTDGNYQGEFSYLGGYFSAKVKFEIKNGKLWLIKFEKLFGTTFTGSSQKVYFAIYKNKNLNFDTVTGATVTSNLAKAAIKNAIHNGSQ